MEPTASCSSQPPPYRVVVLGSGNGSNCRALLEAQERGQLGRARIIAVFSDKPAAGILNHAKEFGVPGRWVDPGPFKTKLEGEGEARFIEAISAEQPDLVVLAGFMRILKPGFLNAFRGRIINLHPSLLPAFPGLDGIGQAWRHGVRIAGCTVHAVDEGVDTGTILDQACVRREDHDTEGSFAEKIHAAEHALLPSVVARISLGTLFVKQ
jgi:phosphoribosylglycinamide formyltransferase-1